MIVTTLLSSKRKVKTNYDENVKRSLIKTISWRVIGTIDTVVVSWLVTGTLAFAFSIGLVELISKMFLYYFHERLWNRITWEKN